MSQTPRDIFAKCSAFEDAKKVKAAGLYPYFRAIEATVGNQVVCEGKHKIQIGSNNYLGLAQDPRVIEAANDATRKYGLGCTGSRFLSGNIKLHEELEAALAEFLGREAVVVLSTGFFANQAALTTLLEDGDFILCDRENHASIIDGCRYSAAKTIPFAHNSTEALRKRLSRLPAEGGRLLIADGVFSMSGDIFNLPEMIKIAKEFNCKVMIDDAHSIGVLGKYGEGTMQHFGMTSDDVHLVMGTFSKSLGSMGGFLAGSQDVIDYIRHKARCFIFTASLSPSIAGGVLQALQILKAEPERIANLWKNTRKMHEGFRSIGFNIGTTQTPICPLLIGSEMKAFVFAQKLYEAGVFATPAVFPAVRYGQAIIRTSYMATHTDQELDHVLEVCSRLGKELGIFEDAAYTGEGSKKFSNGYDFKEQDEEALEAVRTSAGVATPV